MYTSRGVHSWGWREDVHHRRPGDRVWRKFQCGIWAHLLDNHIILRKGRHFASLLRIPVDKYFGGWYIFLVKYLPEQVGKELKYDCSEGRYRLTEYGRE